MQVGINKLVLTVDIKVSINCCNNETKFKNQIVQHAWLMLYYVGHLTHILSELETRYLIWKPYFLLFICYVIGSVKWNLQSYLEITNSSVVGNEQWKLSVTMKLYRQASFACPKYTHWGILPILSQYWVWLEVQSKGLVAKPRHWLVWSSSSPLIIKVWLLGLLCASGRWTSRR